MIDPSNSTLTVKNFGPINEATVELRPLTVFAGPSNTGKSYLAILIYALHQMVRGTASIGNMGGIFGRHLPVQGRVPKNAAKVLRDWFEDMQKRPDVLNMTTPLYQLLRPTLGGYDNLFNEEVSRCFGTDISNLIRYPGKSFANVTVRGYALKDSDDSFRTDFAIDKESRVVAKLPKASAFKVNRSCLMEDFHGFQFLFNDTETMKSIEPDTWTLLQELFSLAIPSIFGTFCRYAFYLPADRTGVMHAHRLIISTLVERATYAGVRTGIRTSALSGVLTDYLQSLIDLDKEFRPKTFGNGAKISANEMNRLAKFLEKDILGGSVIKESSETGYPIFYYHPEGWKDPIHLANTSSMVSELAPIALYLKHIVRPGDVLIIEEPESHLHPSMQVAFARQLAAMVKSGIRVLITTHSEWVLGALSNLVLLSGLEREERKGIAGADQTLTPEQVGIWLFESRNRPKGSMVKEVPLNHDTGLYDTKYDDVGAVLHNEWAETNSRIQRKIASK